jgi:hypothetical protein
MQPLFDSLPVNLLFLLLLVSSHTYDFAASEVFALWPSR